MLHSLLITNHPDTAELLGRVIRQTAQIVVEQEYCPAPPHYQLTRTLNTIALDVVFLDLDIPRAGQLCAEIARQSARTAIVGFWSDPASAHDVRVTRTLSLPLSPGGLFETVRQAVGEICGGPLNKVIGFVPAKGGAGATTTTVNLACHLATTFGKNVCVAEADLRSGTMADWLHTQPMQSIAQSLACADVCGSLLWPRHVCRKFGVDWMLTAREPNLQPRAWCDYRHLLTFVAARYDYTLVDLPDFLDDGVAEVARMCETVFVVTTPEFLSVRLARRRIAELESLGVARSRIRVIMNRQQPHGLRPEDLSAELACELGGAFPADHGSTETAVLEGAFVGDGTKLGRAYRTAAGALTGQSRPVAGGQTVRSRFGVLLSLKRSQAVSPN